MGCCHNSANNFQSSKPLIPIFRKNDIPIDTELLYSDPLNSLKLLEERHGVKEIAQFITTDSIVEESTDKYAISPFSAPISISSVALSILCSFAHDHPFTIEQVCQYYSDKLVSRIKRNDPYAMVFVYRSLKNQQVLLKNSLIKANIFHVLVPLINVPDREIATLAIGISKRLFKRYEKAQNLFLGLKGEWFVSEFLRTLQEYDTKCLMALDAIRYLILVIFSQNSELRLIMCNARKILKAGVLSTIVSIPLVNYR